MVKDWSKLTGHLLITFTWLILLATAWLAWGEEWVYLLIVPLAYCHMGFYALCHDYTHNSPFKKSAHNRLAAKIIEIPSFIYFHQFKTTHLIHHQTSNEWDKDPVSVIKNEAGEFHNPLFYILYWPVKAQKWYMAWINQQSNKAELKQKLLIRNLMSFAVFAVGLVPGILPFLLIFWLIPAFLGIVVGIGAMNLHDHWGCEPHNEYRDSRTTPSRLFNYMFWHNGLHLEHHLNPTANFDTLWKMHSENHAIYESERTIVSRF